MTPTATHRAHMHEPMTYALSMASEYEAKEAEAMERAEYELSGLYAALAIECKAFAVRHGATKQQARLVA